MLLNRGWGGWIVKCGSKDTENFSQIQVNFVDQQHSAVAFASKDTYFKIVQILSIKKVKDAR